MKTLYKIFLILAVIAFTSCEEELTELNVNPNGVDPTVVNPNLVLPTVITGTADNYLNPNYQSHFAGVMQYIQKSGWSGATNDFEWKGPTSWNSWYSNLRNAKHIYERADEMDMDFHKGASLVLKAFNFGYIADTWGDAPYTNALNAAEGGEENYFPVYDTQETIYRGIIGELKEANTLLSQSRASYQGINPDADILYGGDPAKWRKFANTLMLRYYMRLSDKLPTFAKDGIEEIMSDPGTYPIFSSFEDDAGMPYSGTSLGDSWPRNKTFEQTDRGFERVQCAAGIRDVLMGYNDPRLDAWFNPVLVQIQVSEDYPEGSVTVGSTRYVRPDYLTANNLVVYHPDNWVDDVAAGFELIDTNRYVGIPIASSISDGSQYNLNPAPIQGGPNVHVSALDDLFKKPTDDKLLARMITYAEACFILAEAAEKPWNVGSGSQQDWYEKGIEASFDMWGVDGYDDYITEAGVAYDGSLEQIIEQKWIANWTIAHESWCDWRRTGFPQLSWGDKGQRNSMPLRFQYGSGEISRNEQNYQTAVARLVETPFTAQDGKDSAWSKFWLLQD
ncbi:MAG: SusD/RagB family nutrient-binding outer membrane lipoprotein [Bacteroidales bacterium]